MKNLLLDAMVIGGMVSIAYGASLVWLPAGFILGGVALFLLALTLGKKVPGASGSPP
jgi:hypothetical protein